MKNCEFEKNISRYIMAHLQHLFVVLALLHCVPVLYAVQIHRAVISLPAFVTDGRLTSHAVSNAVLQALEIGSENIISKIQKAGGEWRLLETPFKAYLVVLLPTSASESVTILEDLIIALKDKMAAINLQQKVDPSDAFQEYLLGKILGETVQRELVPSLWSDGWPPYLEQRLQKAFEPISEFYKKRLNLDSVSTDEHWLTTDAISVRTLTWKPASASSHFAARYICEVFEHLPDLTAKTTFCEVFDSPDSTTLMLSVSAALNGLADQEAFLDRFLATYMSKSSPTGWEKFASAAMNLMQLEYGDLAKSALTTSVFNENKWPESPKTSLEWLPPNTCNSCVLFSETSWNFCVQGFKGDSPLLIASANSFPEKAYNIVEAAFLLPVDPERLWERLKETNEYLIANGFYTAQVLKCSPTEICVCIPVTLENFRETLKKIEMALPFKAISVLTTSVPPYKIAAFVDGFVTLNPRDAGSENKKLTAENLKSLLNASSTSKTELAGRWAVCLASSSRCAAFLARLAEFGVALKSLQDIDNLISGL